MTSELINIREEITDLNDRWGDLAMLESLANNVIFVLSKMQQSGDEYTSKQRNAISNVITDILNTLNKELQWARELEETDAERVVWFKKAKYQILEDMNCLFA
jgi:predicted methyltransferase